MMGIIGLIAGVTALCVTAARDTEENESRQRDNRIKGFDTYIDTKGVQRSSQTGRPAISMHNKDGDWCLTDMKTGQIYRNYDEEKRQKLKNRLEQLNRNPDMREFNKKCCDAKLDYETVWAEDPNDVTGTNIINRRVSDGLLLESSGQCGMIKTKDYGIGLQIFIWDYYKYPEWFFCKAAYMVDMNKNIIKNFDPNWANPLGFKSKIEFENWVKKIGGVLEIEDCYKKIGIEMPDYKIIKNSITLDYEVEVNGWIYNGMFPEQKRKLKK